MMKMNKKQNITVLFGGVSSEREVSIKSAMEVVPVISDQYDVDMLELNYLNFSSFINEIRKGSLVFNSLHGGEGENGQIQSFLTQHKIKYTGSESGASMLAMNKHFTKIIASENNIKTPKWLSVNINNLDEAKILSYKSSKFTYPVVVKPNFEGSTLGLSIVRDKEGMNDAVELASKYSNNIIVEEFIDGRELTVGVLGDKALDIVEIIPKSGFYDYESKYTKGATEYICPAKINSTISKTIKQDALKIHKALGCRHYSRVDFLLGNQDSNPYMLEINTLPGLSETSLLPMSASSAGIGFRELINAIIDFSI